MSGRVSSSRKSRPGTAATFSRASGRRAKNSLSTPTSSKKSRSGTPRAGTDPFQSPSPSTVSPTSADGESDLTLDESSLSDGSTPTTTSSAMVKSSSSSSSGGAAAVNGISIKMDSIRVCARFRPQNSLEKSVNGQIVIKIGDDNASVSLPGRPQFNFDRVFGTDTAQEIVFDYTARPLVDSVINGYNCTVFAYGQTGSGKTFTMEGQLGTPSRGVIPRIVETIFESIENSEEHMEYTVKVSHIEIYMERIKDLLDPSKTNLRIRENKGIYIDGVSEVYAGSADDVMKLMNRGSANRAIASTRMNMGSSRSHSVFILTISQQNTKTSSKKSSKLMMVDLAGSEKVRKTEASGQQLLEAQKINQSLSSLGNVINSLSEGKSHIPYRDSKLTRLLSDSIGGNSKTTLIVTASPSSYNCDETLSTLRFGQRAKRVKNKPIVNQEKSIAEYKALLAAAGKQEGKLQEIIKALKRDLVQAKSALKNAGLEMPQLSAGEFEDEDSAAARELNNDSIAMVEKLQEQIEALEMQNSEVSDEKESLVDEVSDLKSELEIQRQNADHQESQVRDAHSQLSSSERKAQELSDKLTEYEFYKNKQDLVEKEHVIQINHLKKLNETLNDQIKQFFGDGPTVDAKGGVGGGIVSPVIDAAARARAHTQTLEQLGLKPINFDTSDEEDSDSSSSDSDDSDDSDDEDAEKDNEEEVEVVEIEEIEEEIEDEAAAAESRKQSVASDDQSEHDPNESLLESTESSRLSSADLERELDGSLPSSPAAPSDRKSLSPPAAGAGKKGVKSPKKSPRRPGRGTPSRTRRKKFDESPLDEQGEMVKPPLSLKTRRAIKRASGGAADALEESEKSLASMKDELREATAGRAAIAMPEFYKFSAIEDTKLNDGDAQWKHDMENKMRGLYADLSRKIGQHVMLQQEHADLECELEEYRGYFDQMKSKGKGPSLSQLLEQNRQVTRSYHQQSLENERLRTEARQHQKLLKNWQSQMEQMEHAVRESKRIHQLQMRRRDEEMKKVEEELNMYRSVYGAQNSHNIVPNMSIDLTSTTNGRSMSVTGTDPTGNRKSKIVVPIQGHQKSSPVSKRKQSKSSRSRSSTHADGMSPSNSSSSSRKSKSRLGSKNAPRALPRVNEESKSAES